MKQTKELLEVGVYFKNYMAYEPYIVSTHNICGGRPRLANTRITVGRIITLNNQGLSPEEIADNWGTITVYQVYAALGYYDAAKDQIDKQLADDRDHYEELFLNTLN